MLQVELFGVQHSTSFKQIFGKPCIQINIYITDRSHPSNFFPHHTQIMNKQYGQHSDTYHISVIITHVYKSNTRSYRKARAHTHTHKCLYREVYTEVHMQRSSMRTKTWQVQREDKSKKEENQPIEGITSVDGNLYMDHQRHPRCKPIKLNSEG